MQLTLEIEEQIKASLKLIRILLIFFVFTVGVLMLLPQLGFIKRPAMSTVDLLQPMYVLLSFLFAFNGFILKGVLIKAEVLPDPKQQVIECIRAFHLSHLVAFVSFELVGLLGFVNYLLSDNPYQALTYGVVSLCCMIIAWPRRVLLEQQIIDK